MRDEKMKDTCASRVVRFADIGFHPDVDKTGAICTKSYNLVPGQYHPESFVYPDQMTYTSSWTRKLNLEDFSANLGHMNPRKLHEVAYYKAGRGPGTYDVKDTRTVRAVAFGSVKRFRDKYRPTSIPPPGTYDKNVIDRSSVNKKQMTSVPPMEWDGFRDRFARPSMPWKLPSNLHNPIDRGSMDAIMSKLVSRRGPYDCFTGPRDPTTLKGYLSPPIKCTPDKFYTYPSTMDRLLHNESYRRTGKFFKDKRFSVKPTVRMMLDDVSTCYRDPDTPSPASYVIDNHCIKPSERSLHPFNNSKLVVREFVPWKVQPGVGRYNIKIPPNKADRKRRSWVFKSKVGRTLYQCPQYGFYD